MKIVICSMLMTTSVYISRKIFGYIYSPPAAKTTLSYNIFNQYVDGGAVVLAIALLSQHRYFNGRKIMLIMCIIILITIWNFVWIIFSDIYELENVNVKNSKNKPNTYTLEEMSYFDFIMFRGDCTLSFAAYYTIIVVGPLDICKLLMLKENKKIYALTLCFMGSFKYTVEAIVLD